ncbi:MAG: type IV pilus twitching motility protein PilT, partial [Anaeromyxobacteraceae bacterium]
MPRLDAFIEKLLAVPSAELVFETGNGAVLQGPTERVRLLQQPLTTGQIVGAFAEVVPSELQNGFPRAGTTAFAYAARGADVQIEIERRGDTVRAVVVRAGAATSRAATSTASPSPTPTPRNAPTPKPAQPLPTVESSEPPPPPNPPDPREAIETLLAALAERRGSDLHLASGEVPAMRIDGDVVPLASYGRIPAERIAAMLWAIAPARSRAEWEETHDADFAHETTTARFRANVFADRKGVGAVFRVIPRDILTVEALGIPPAVLDLCGLTKGLVLVTGPTGSGKSTTLAALVDHVNRTRDDHIITIEDPIEFVHPPKRCLVNQREVGAHTTSFKRALRAALREDPDVILVGELRDLETVAIAIETAETGHLVFGTLHTTTAPSTIDRIIDQFPEDRQAQIRMMLSESLKGVISQTLCKKVGTGRVPAQEILLCNNSVANLIREGKTFQIPSVMQTSRGIGMTTMNDTLFDLVKKNVVTAKDAYIKAV